MSLVVKGISERRRTGADEARPVFWRSMSSVLKMCNTADEGGEEGVRYPVSSSSIGVG